MKTTLHKITKYIFIANALLFFLYLSLTYILRIAGLRFRSWTLVTAACSFVLLIVSILIFIWNRLKQAHIYIRVITAVISAIIFLTISGFTLIFTIFAYQPEHVVVRDNRKLVACVNSFLNVDVDYYPYKNIFVSGNTYIISEFYGNGGYDPFTWNPMPEPRSTTYFDEKTGKPLKTISDHNDSDNPQLEIPIEDSERQELIQKSVQTALLYEEIWNQSEKGSAINPVLSKEDVTAIIERLEDNGYAVSDADSLQDMRNWEEIDRFCEAADKNETASASIYQILRNGGFQRYDFMSHNGILEVTASTLLWDENNAPVVPAIARYNASQFLYTEKGFFMFEKYYPDNLEMNGCHALRIKPLGAEFRELTETYLAAVGYMGNNLFLTDWNSDSIEQINFSDLFEFLYPLYYNIPIDASVYIAGVPADTFEQVICSFLPINADTLKQTSYYDPLTATYKWNALDCGSYTLVHLPVPEVVGCTENSDGTITLTVDAVLEEDLNDQVFTHKVTILPDTSETASFQYLSNKIIYADDDLSYSYLPRNIAD